MLFRSKQIKPTGRVVLQMPFGASVKDLPDMSLENGDRIYIPPQPSMVNVFGSVVSENSFVYQTGLRISDYLQKAGGVGRYGDARNLYMLRANGETVGRGQDWLSASITGLEVYPGDTIVVPEEFDRTTLVTKIKDYSQILLNFGLGAAAVHVLTK